MVSSQQVSSQVVSEISWHEAIHSNVHRHDSCGLAARSASPDYSQVFAPIVIVWHRTGNNGTNSRYARKILPFRHVVTAFVPMD
jgi:hypothetical protein